MVQKAEEPYTEMENKKACVRFDTELMQKVKLYAVQNRMRQFKVVEQALNEFFDKNQLS